MDWFSSRVYVTTQHEVSYPIAAVLDPISDQVNHQPSSAYAGILMLGVFRFESMDLRRL